MTLMHIEMKRKMKKIKDICRDNILEGKKGAQVLRQK